MPDPILTAEPHITKDRIRFLRNVLAGYVNRRNGRDRIRYPDGSGHWCDVLVRAELAATPGPTIFLGASGQYRLTPFGEAILRKEADGA